MGKKGFTYTLQIDAEIDNLVAKTNTVKKSMESIMSAGKAPGAEKIFGSIERAIERMQQKASQPIESVAAFAALEKDAAAVEVQLKKLSSVVEGLGNMSMSDKLDLLPPDLKKQIEDANSALVAFSKAEAQAAQKTQDLIDAENGLAAAQKELKKAEGRVQDKKALVDAQQALVNKTHEEADAIKAKIEALKKYQTTAAAYAAAGGDKRKAGGGKEELAGLNLPADRAAAKKIAPDLDLGDTQAVADEINRLGEAYSQASKAVTDAESTQRRYSKQLNEANNAATVASGKVIALEQSVAELNEEFEKDKAKNVQAAYTKLRDEAGKLGVDLTNIPVDYTEQNLLELNEAMNKLAVDGIAQVDQKLNSVEINMEKTGIAADALGSKMVGTKNDIAQLDAQVSSTQAFTQRIAQFVGLEGGIEIARSAMRNAMNTIKELDKAMTEMAVVTDLGVGDYWDQLPEHTERANALGMSIKSVYEAETLYYQQGLKRNEVEKMSIETLKMARIAGLSAEDATNKMTAALRGFNMELNETSAQRISDVYSELAAITASDVDEISSAMTKTASIAASAGMEFETTAAFLSQIIETTRESAETAGTALKTVIARFQELKKDPAEIGEVDGEMVDANKIETALRSVGVSLRDTSGQFRELDDVFLELSSKWDSLDTNTQRYIATIAAGSRQQSRFIAMMSDYSRTQELVTAANTSAGASNEQFEKTMESLESKLAELKNAWDSFTMGIMDSELIKVGVDLLTNLLGVLNSISDFFDRFGLGGAASIGMVIGALYLGDKALKIFSASVKAGGTIFQSFGAIGRAATQSVSNGITKVITALKNMQKTLEKNRTSMKTFGKVKMQVDTADATKALANYKKATADQMKLMKERELLAQDASLDDAARQAKSMTLDQAKVASEKSKTAAIQEYAAATGLTNAQASAAIALETMGIGADTAKMAALGGLTAAKMAEYQATMIANGMDATQIATNMAEIASIYAVAGAQTTENATQATGIGLLWGKITAGIVHIATLVAQTVAQWAYNIAMYAGCPPTLALAAAILIIVAVAALAIAAIVGIVAGIIALVKAIKANSPEGKLEAAKDAAKAAADAAKQAKEAYEGLANAFDSLSDKYAALDDLTKGTREWRDAVKEINSEVLDLIEKYPELANLVKNEDGVLTIDLDSDEAQDVLNKYEAKAMQTNSMDLGAKMAVMRAQTAVDYKNLSDGAELGNQTALGFARAGAWTLGASSALTGSINGMGATHMAFNAIKEEEARNQKNTDAMAQALAEGLLVKGAGGYNVTAGSEDELAALGLTEEEAKRFAKELGNNADELKEYGKAVKARTEQEEAMYAAAALNAVQLVDTAGMTEEEIGQINVAATSGYAEVFEKQALEEIQSTMDGMGKNEMKDWVKAQAMEMYGTDEISVDNDGNVTIGSGDDAKKVNRENFQSQLAMYQSTGAAAEALEKLPSAIDAAAKKMGAAGKAFQATFNGKDGSALTGNDLATLQSYTSNIHRLGEVYHSLSEEEQEAFGNFENFESFVLESLTTGQNAFKEASEDLEAMGVSVKFNGKMTAEAIKGYSSQLESIAITSGTESVEQVNALMNSLVDNLNPEQVAVFMREVNSLDWTNQSDWDKLPDLLAEVGLSLPITELEAFIDKASASANAIHKIDFSKISGGMNTLQSLIKSIRSGETGRTIESDQYEKLLEINPELASHFGETIEGEFVYLGSTMNNLIDTIQENTDTWVARREEELQNAIGAGEIMREFQSTYHWNGIELDITQWKDWEEDGSTDSSAENYLKQFMSAAKEKGLDLSTLGIKNLTNSTDIGKLVQSPEKLEQVMNDLSGVLTSLNKNIDELNTGLTSELSKIYQNRNIVSNQQDIGQYRSKLLSGKDLTDKEKSEHSAYQQTILIQAQSAGVNEVDYNNYSKMVVAAQNWEKAYDDGRVSLSQFQEEYSKIMGYMEEFEKKVVNISSMNNARASMVFTLESFGEAFEKYLTLGVSDIEGKMETVAAAVSKLGIQVTEDNYESIASLIDLTLEGGENGIQALATLLDYSAAKYGLSQSEFLSMEEQNWEKASTNQLLYADQMVAAGMAQWKVLADGTKQFVWITQDILEASLEESGAQVEQWVSQYDRLWNLNESLNGTIRERERLELKYERALASTNSSAQELTDLIAEQMVMLHQEAFAQSEIAKESLATMRNLAAENAEFSQYYKFDASNGTFTVDSEAVANANWTTEQGEKFDEFISQMQDAADSYEESTDSLADINDSLEELAEAGKEELSDIYNQVKEGLTQSYQDQIDAMQNIYEAVNEAASQIVDKIQTSIDEARQARDTEKAKQSLSDKQLRLEYLKRDTTGGRALDIAALQKEIDQETTDLTDSMVDQEIAKLQKQNEEAAEQRERQIELANQQLERYIESGEIWSEVKTIVSEGLKAVADGQSIMDTRAGTLIASAEEIKTKNPIEQQEFSETLESSAKLGAIAGGFTTVSDAVTELSGAGKVTISDLKQVVSTSIETMDGSIQSVTESIGILGNTAIPNAVAKASGVLTSGLRALYTSSGAMSSTVKAALASGLSQIAGSVSQIKSAFSSSSSSIASALSAALYTGTKSIVSAVKGIKIDRNTGGGATAGTKVTEAPIINDPPTAASNVVETPKKEYPDKVNLGTTISDKEFVEWAKTHKVEGSSETGLPTVDNIMAAEKKSSVNMSVNTSDAFMHKGQTYWSVGNGYYIKQTDVKQYNIRDYGESGRAGYWHTEYSVPADKQLYKKYKTGGLADFTGPAWLDGTKSRPEIVLNQTDSANFMQLRDILADILNGTSSLGKTSGAKGDNYYDVNITVESLSDDYDVEQLADKIKSMIYDDAVYRNVNSISGIR